MGHFRLNEQRKSCLDSEVTARGKRDVLVTGTGESKRVPRVTSGAGRELPAAGRPVPVPLPPVPSPTKEAATPDQAWDSPWGAGNRGTFLPLSPPPAPHQAHACTRTRACTQARTHSSSPTGPVGRGARLPHRDHSCKGPAVPPARASAASPGRWGWMTPSGPHGCASKRSSKLKPSPAESGGPRLVPVPQFPLPGRQGCRPPTVRAGPPHASARASDARSARSLGVRPRGQRSQHLALAPVRTLLGGTTRPWRCPDQTEFFPAEHVCASVHPAPLEVAPRTPRSGE